MATHATDDERGAIVERLLDPTTRAAARRTLREDAERIDWQDPAREAALVALVPEAPGDCADILDNVHTAALDAAFARVLASPNDGAAAFEYLATSASDAMLDAAASWLAGFLDRRPAPPLAGRVQSGVMKLLARAPERAHRPMVAFLETRLVVEAPAADDRFDNATWRLLFELVAMGLSPSETWRLASRALGGLGKGAWGATTREVVAKAALVRHVESAGMAALDDVVASFDTPYYAVPAVRALTRHPSVDRPRVLEAVLPHIVGAAPRMAAETRLLAAVALHALAPDATPEALGLPASIVVEWPGRSARLPSPSESLAALGIEVGEPALENRPLSRDTLHDALERAGRLARFDTESGSFPVPYARLLREILAPLARSIAPVDVDVYVRRSRRGARYEVTISARTVFATTVINDEGEYYQVGEMVDLFNRLFDGAGAVERFFLVASGDQGAIILCASPSLARRLALEGLRITVPV